MISKMFFKKVPFFRKKGIFTKKGFILDEIKKGFELKTNTIIFGDSEIRKKIFISNIYSSLLNKSDSSLSVLREDFGVILAKELSSAGSDFRFINLSDDIKECSKVIEDFKKLSTFDSNNIVAIFPRDTIQYASNATKIHNNLSNLIEAFEDYLENTFLEKQGNLNHIDSSHSDHRFLFDQCNYYGPHIKCLERLPSLLSKVSKLNWRGFWSVDSMSITSINNFSENHQNIENKGNPFLESLFEISDPVYFIFEENLLSFNIIDKLIKKITQSKALNKTPKENKKKHWIDLKNDSEFFVSYVENNFNSKIKKPNMAYSVFRL